MSAPSGAEDIAARVGATLDGPLSAALLTLDRALASQTQTYSPRGSPFSRVSSAQLNIAYTSLDELTKYAQTRLDGARTSFKTGLSDAAELQRELADLERRVRALKDRMRDRWPVEYYTVRDETDG